MLERWLTGLDHVVPPLDRWLVSYQGHGAGAVDLAHYPDPYVGDLRGLRSEPRLVVLGLNPGLGYDELQGPDGTWSQRTRELGYSRGFAQPGRGPGHGWNSSTLQKRPLTCGDGSQMGNAVLLIGNPRLCPDAVKARSRQLHRGTQSGRSQRSYVRHSAFASDERLVAPYVPRRSHRRSWTTGTGRPWAS